MNLILVFQKQNRVLKMADDFRGLKFWLLPITFFFLNMKTWLGCKRFSSNEEIIAATNEYFEGFDKHYFLKGIKTREYRYNKCIELKGDYVEN